MQVHVNSNNSVNKSENMIQWASDQVEKGLDHYSGMITRVEVHFNDTNSDKGGATDKYCSIEAKLAGLPPMATNHKAPSFDLALDGALEKLEKVISRSVGKLDHKKGRTPIGGEPFADLPDQADV